MEVNLSNPQKESGISKLLDTYRVRQAILLSVDIFLLYDLISYKFYFEI